MKQKSSVCKDTLTLAGNVFHICLHLMSIYRLMLTHNRISGAVKLPSVPASPSVKRSRLLRGWDIRERDQGADHHSTLTQNWQ